MASEATEAIPLEQSTASERECSFRGKLLTLYEDDTLVEIRRGREVRYRWRKGTDWPSICAPEFLLT